MQGSNANIVPGPKDIIMFPRTCSASLLGLLLTSTAVAQNDCADLTIASVRYSPLNASFLEVRILNSGGFGFSYPSLVLFDANGDTLAWGSTGLFGLGGDHTVAIQLVPGTVLPAEPFSATLELWIGSWTQLACSFDLVIDPCPTEACTQVYPHVIAGILDPGGLQFDWTVSDSTGTTMATGSMVIPEGTNQIQDTVCLPVGAYSLGMVNPFGIGEFIYFTMIGSAWASSPQVEVETGDVSPFILFEACMENANAIDEVTDQGLHLAIVNGVLRVWRTDGPPLREVRVMDAAGQLVRSAVGQKTSLELDIAALAAGVLVVKATNAQGVYSCRRISWVP
jgi:hypothetical protein